MCIPALGALAPALVGGGAATAAGATAAATTAAAGIGQTLATAGTLASIGGSIYQGIAGARAARQQADLLEQQRQDELKLSAIEDDRIREKFRTELGRQRAELVARGISLDSPTAVLLGESAAREASFESQSRRSTGQARATELSATERQVRARGRLSLLQGGLSAVSTFLERAPETWPGLLNGGSAA
jgi:hypothetical protein